MCKTEGGVQIEDGVYAHYEFMQFSKHESHQEWQLSVQMSKTEKPVLYLWKLKYIAVVVLIVFWKSFIDVNSQYNIRKSTCTKLIYILFPPHTLHIVSFRLLFYVNHAQHSHGLFVQFILLHRLLSSAWYND